MRYADIKGNDIVNGEGICVSFWTQGCPHHCPGCFNPETWDFDGGSKEFSPLIIDEIPCMDLVEKSQCFPLYYYKENEENQNALFDEFNKDKYIRHDGITDWILKQSRSIYGKSVEKEDIFYYVYGFLHSKEYRTKYAADLKKMLPRIPLVDKKEDFWAFSKAGRQLANLHLHYETVEPISGLDVKFTGDMGNEYDYFSVEKLRFLLMTHS